MELGIGNELIQIIIVIEFSLIILMMFLTYFAKFSSWLLNKRREKLKNAIEKFLMKTMTQKQFNLKEVTRRYKKIQFLFPIFTRVNNAYQNDPRWLAVRQDIIMQLLLPLARKRARARRWLLRLYSAEVFNLMYETKDEPLLLRLLRDRIPLVYLHSIKVAVKNKSEAGINAIINRMAKMSWITQTMYLTPFEDATLLVREYVEMRLKTSNDESIRTECYKILMKFPTSRIDWDIHNDLQSKQFELRLTTLKFLVYSDGKDTIPILLDKLTDSHFEIKIVAIHELVKLKAQEALLPIANCLNDADWRVKMNVVQALKSLGPDGERLLQSKAPELLNMNIDVKEHLPGNLW